jgi:hypothetical protein
MQTFSHITLAAFCILASSAVAQPSSFGTVVELSSAKLTLDTRGRVIAFCRRDGSSLLARQSDLPFMMLRIGPKWHKAITLAASGEGRERQLRLGFEGTPVTARAVLRSRDDYFEIETVALDGDGSEAVQQWCFVNVPVNLTANIGTWLNTAWDENFATAVIALEEKTDARGAPQLQAVAHRVLGLTERKAAVIACPTPRLLAVIRDIERTHGLPSPTLGGQWAKTSGEARKSWMITGLAVNDKLPAYAAERVFTIAKSLGVQYVVIGLGWWNRTFGHYAINSDRFPNGMESLKAAADRAHALGLKLGLHVMTGSITKNDSYVTPVPDPRLCRDAETALAADVDGAARNISTRGPIAGFGRGAGYWAPGGVDAQIDDEIIRYGRIAEDSFTFSECVRGAYGTRAAPHKAGAKVRHISERYGWYVANPELAADIGCNLADVINRAGLDMICFDGADVQIDPQTQFYRGHQVAQSLLRHARRDVLVVSNGSTHFGWHCMARGGEDDAMARGFKRWVDDHTVHGWGDSHRSNFLIPDFSWVGIFPHTPTLTAARPDDVELVCARSLGYDAAIGWGFAACYGGASNADTFSRNGRREEIASVIRTYEKLRMENYFSAEARQPLQHASEWRLLPPKAEQSRYQLTPARYSKSGIIRPGATWQIQNDLGPQPLCVRIEALPAVAAYGADDNVVVADFAKLQFKAAGNAAAKTTIQLLGESHPQAGAVVRLSCSGPKTALPPRLAGHGQPAWSQASATFPAKLNLSHHRALGLWVKGDGSGATLNVQLELTPQSYLHFYQPINFSGWRYCELGEAESDRVMDYFSYDKFAMHDVKLDRFASMTLMILNPPRGRNVALELGRIEALRETGGLLAHPRVVIANAAMELAVTLEIDQYLETGDPWGTRDPAVCRVFDADGHELRHLKLAAPPQVPAGVSTVHLEAGDPSPARARVTVILKGENIH